ncbi:MAG: nucleoside recognition domain-containing protein [Chitinophagaceae bacterium]
MATRNGGHFLLVALAPLLSRPMLNYIWVALLLIGFLVGLIKAIFVPGASGMMTDMLNGIFSASKTGFEISIGLTGVMALWLGIMKIGEKAGVIRLVSRGVAPLFRTLFKKVPAGHPAYGSITMNLSANMLGLGNAATPLGLKAMAELQELNEDKERATDAQIMFLVLNTAGITLVPTSVIAIRQTMAVEQHVANFNAADIFLPTLIATFIAFVCGMTIVAIHQRINLLKLPVLIFIGIFGGLIGGIYGYVQHMISSGATTDQVSNTIGAIGSGFILCLVMLFIAAGAFQKQKVFENFVEGAKEGFNVAVRIIPFLVGMLIAISIFRVSGCMDFIVSGIANAAAWCGLNTDFVPVVPVMLMKPLSGSGAQGLMVDVMKQYGVASFPGKLAAILQGTTETTFYVLAVYFGSVGVKNTRSALVLGLIADLIGMVAAIILGYLFFH